ncbi:MAG: hypothetical protein MUF15_10845 [Acidobacteria bacterium]|jgi:hypothetical protein|nr:hypothetical protein [Acidobacteriota bacterium]
MKKGFIKGFLWVAAFILTVMLAFFQRLTGPTHPLTGKESLNGKDIHYKMRRSAIEFKPLPVRIKAPGDLLAWLNYKRYKTPDEWTEMAMKREGDFLVAEIPGQKAGGKVEYSVRLQVNNENMLLNKGKSIVVRFRGEVPGWILIIHVIFMFMGILFAIRTGMEALRKNGNYIRLAYWTLGFVLVGGFILGPIVQEYAFGSYWTGFPFGTDLTDNKTLLAFIFWLAALFLGKKNRWWIVAAALLMIVVYLIPHSVMGSELDYQSGMMRNKY